LAGRSSFELATERAAFATRFTTPALETVWSESPVPVSRDPFIPEAPVEHVSSAPPSVVRDGIVGMHVTQGDPIGFTLQTNRGTTGSPRVSAIVTGASPRALVDDGTRVRVVAVGDTLAGARISAIDAFGVHLETGVVFGIAEDQP
jgi:hypothetical protein